MMTAFGGLIFLEANERAEGSLCGLKPVVSSLKPFCVRAQPQAKKACRCRWGDPGQKCLKAK